MKFFSITLALLFALTTTGAANAQWGGFGASYLYGYGSYGSGLGYSAYRATPPYFALHPPVYYGERYRRPYGVSPFAAGPQLQANPNYAPTRAVDTARIHAGTAVMGAAPCCANGTQRNAGPVEPLVVKNPFFGTDDKVQYTQKK